MKFPPYVMKFSETESLQNEKKWTFLNGAIINRHLTFPGRERNILLEIKYTVISRIRHTKIYCIKNSVIPRDIKTHTKRD